MPKYNVYLQTHASTVVEVEADSKEDAVDAALEQDMPRICAQCSGWGRTTNLELGEDWDLAGSLDEAVEEGA